MLKTMSYAFHRMYFHDRMCFIKQYSSPAWQAGDDELCVRQLSLIVLFYEAIVDDVLGKLEIPKRSAPYYYDAM